MIVDETELRKLMDERDRLRAERDKARKFISLTGADLAALDKAESRGIRKGLQRAANMAKNEALDADRFEGHPGAALRRLEEKLRAAAVEKA